MKYTLTTTYLDGMISRFDFEPVELIKEIAERILNQDIHRNVYFWEITPNE